MITYTTSKHYWNYFLALEKNLENISRYIEFSNDNLKTYSIELAHILLSTASEVDVIMKLLCKLLDNSSTANNINEYRIIIKEKCPDFINEEITIGRFGMKFKPWLNWNGEENPDWWKGYNKVKHERNSYFNKANLQNTVNAIGALLITVYYYYKFQFTSEAGRVITFKETTGELGAQSSFMRINNDDYYNYAIVI